VDRKRLCKLCRKKFTFDHVKSEKGDDGSTIAHYLKEKSSVGIMHEGVVVCAACLKEKFELEGIEGVEVKSMGISRWYNEAGELGAISWDRVYEDGFSIVRAFVAREKFRGSTKLQQKVEKGVTADQLKATEDEALQSGMLEVSPDSFNTFIGTPA
jgi:hypothetical protein